MPTEVFFFLRKKDFRGLSGQGELGGTRIRCRGPTPRGITSPCGNEVITFPGKKKLLCRRSHPEEEKLVPRIGSIRKRVFLDVFLTEPQN